MGKIKIQEEAYEDIKALYIGGKSCQEISEVYGVAFCTIGRILRKIGTTMRTGKEAKVVDYARPGRKIARYWLGKKQPPEMIKKRLGLLAGEKHGMYKDGSCMRTYRQKGIKKEICELCNSVDHLAIHHRDFDHYNDDPNNLGVLCLACHSRIHKNEYWKNIKAGKEYKTNAPNHWK